MAHMGDGFYRSKNPTNSIKILKEKSYKGKPIKHKENTKYTYAYTYKIVTIKRYTYKAQQVP